MDSSDLPTPLCDKEYEQVVADITNINYSSPKSSIRFPSTKLEKEVDHLIKTSQTRTKGKRASRIVSSYF